MTTRTSVSDMCGLPRLDALLNSIKTRLIVIEAPAGFGKSVQARKWATRLSSIKRNRVTWVDRRRHELLFDYVENSEEKPKECHWVFIDDAHRFGGNIQKKLSDLAIHESSSLRVVLIRRYDASTRFAAEQFKGQAAFVTQDELAFTQEEIRSYRKCTKTEAKDIYRKYRGWPAAITHLDNVELFWSLIEEDVISGLPDECLEEFIELSIIPSLDIKDAQAILEQSHDELSVLFRKLDPVLSLDMLSMQRVMHPCVSEGLQRMGWAQSPLHMKALHMKACQYFWDTGEIVKALEHASKSGETHYVCQLIEEAGGLFLWLNEGLERIQQVMSFADDKLCENYPRLMLVKALLHVKQGKLDQANKCLKTAKAVSDDFSRDRPDGNNIALQDEARLMTTLLAGYGCHSLEEQIALAQPTLKDTDAIERDEAHKGYYHTIMCLHALQKGRFDDARHQADLSETAFEKVGSDYGILYLDFHRGVAAYGEGNLALSRECYTRAEARRRRLFSEDEGLKFIGKVLAAELDCETGAFLSVKRKLKGVLHKLHVSEAWFEIYAAAMRSKAYLTFLDQGYEPAMTILYDFSREAKSKGLKRVTRYADTIRLELASRANDNSEAARLAAKLRLQDSLKDGAKLGHLMWREYVADVTAFALYSDLCGEAEKAKTYIDDLIDYGRSNKNRVCELYGLSLKVTLYAKLQDRLIELLQTTGFILPIALSPRLQGLLKTQKAGGNLLIGTEEAISNLYPVKRSLFTKREREIINHLAGNQSDKDIALDLDISVHTVRFHMKNIFHKTGAHDRESALNKAKMMVN